MEPGCSNRQLAAWTACRGLLIVIFALQGDVLCGAITPIYQFTDQDCTWTHQGSGSYTVDTACEDYVNEIWERPVQDQGWSDSGGTRTSNGAVSNSKYYGYGDLKEASWGVGTNDGTDYLFARWEVVGDFIHEGGKSPESKELEGHYYFYAQTTGEKGFAVEVNLPKDLSSSFADDTGKLFAYTEDTINDAIGTGITVTFETGFDGYSQGGESKDAYGRTITSTHVTEVAVPLADLGVTLADFDSVDYAYAGVAVSNPSAANTDLFANDAFVEAAGSGVEYDTLRFSMTTVLVPEPSTYVSGLGFIAILGFTVRRYRRKTVQQSAATAI
jgi:hypothetical protein